MKPEDFAYVAKMLKERSGLIVTQDKAYLLESRLTPIARKRGLTGLDDLLRLLPKGGEDLQREVTEAMTTNESFFFRDMKPFDQFRALVLPQLIKNRAAKRSFRIWSAACSSGQEAYSLSMILKEEAAKLAGWRIEIVGTDISHEMVEKSRAGLYTQFEVQRGLPVQMMVKYFKKVNESWQIDPSLRQMVQFKEYNLLGDLKSLGQFDVVFCRNVLIYFDQPTKTKVLENISKIVPDDGILYLGGAETVLGISDKFKPIPEQRGIYGVSR
jgi:chemotaxis protein methyltransferase CheR